MAHPTESGRDAAQGRSILITGCSSGIGLATAVYLRDRGWRVFASCRKEADCARLREMGFESPRIDYQDEASIRDGAAEAQDAVGGALDALFNNGAFAVPGGVEDLPTDALRDIFEANFFGWHTLTRAVLPAMRARGAGRILQNSSVLGFVALKFRGAYISTKFALEGLTDTLRLELDGSGVHVVLIQPGPVTSLIRENSYAHFKRWIVWEGSPHAAIYPKVDARLGGESPPDRFELPAEAVAIKAAAALDARRPKLRYRVTFPTYLLAAMKRVAPGRTLDRMLINQSY